MKVCENEVIREFPLKRTRKFKQNGGGFARVPHANAALQAIATSGTGEHSCRVFDSASLTLQLLLKRARVRSGRFNGRMIATLFLEPEATAAAIETSLARSLASSCE